MYDLKCVFCGARLIQQIGRLPISKSEATERRRAVLADWVKYGHAEKDLRALVKGPLAMEPVVKKAKR